jgi:hypothetical protein
MYYVEIWDRCEHYGSVDLKKDGINQVASQNSMLFKIRGTAEISVSFVIHKRLLHLFMAISKNWSKEAVVLPFHEWFHANAAGCEQ